MRIGIMGAGAVGSYFGGKLARSGNDVVMVARGEHYARVKHDGLKVRSIDGDFHLFVKMVPTPADVGECDLILFCVKSYDTVEVAKSMESMVGEGTTVISLQNGVDNEEKLCEVVGMNKVVGGLCYVGARIDRPGEVIHSAAGRVIIGELDGRMTIRLAGLHQLFEEANIPVVSTPYIALEQWQKLCWNLSFNTISALTLSTVGQILDQPACAQVVKGAIGEAVMVAQARGIDLPEDYPERVLTENDAYRDIRTSMLQDAEKGRRLEYEALNGVVMRYGREAGIATPINDTLYGLVSCIDAK